MIRKSRRIDRLEAENSVLRAELRTARHERDYFKEGVERAAQRHDGDALLPRMTFLRRVGRRLAPCAMSLGFSGWFFARYEVWFCEDHGKTYMQSHWPESPLFKFTLPEALRFARKVGPAEGQHLELVDLGTGRHRRL